MATLAPAALPAAHALSRRTLFWRILGATLVAAAVAAILNALLRAWAVTSLDVPQPQFEPLNLIPVVVSSALGALAAGATLAVLARLVARPLRWLGALTAVALLASMAPPIGLLVMSPAAYPGTRGSWVGVLVLMHVVVAAVSYGLLTLAWRAPVGRGGQR